MTSCFCLVLTQAHVLVLKLTSVLKLWVFLSSHMGHHCKHSLLLFIQLPGRAHKDSDYIAMITIVHWCNKIFPSSFHCSLNSNSHGLHLACALIGMSHKLAAYSYTGSLWTRLEYKLVDGNRVYPGIRCQGQSKPATRSVVATCYTPGIKIVWAKVVPKNLMIFPGLSGRCGEILTTLSCS